MKNTTAELESSIWGIILFFMITAGFPWQLLVIMTTEQENRGAIRNIQRFSLKK